MVAGSRVRVHSIIRYLQPSEKQRTGTLPDRIAYVKSTNQRYSDHVDGIATNQRYSDHVDGIATNQRYSDHVDGIATNQRRIYTRYGCNVDPIHLLDIIIERYNSNRIDVTTVTLLDITFRAKLLVYLT